MSFRSASAGPSNIVLLEGLQDALDRRAVLCTWGLGTCRTTHALPDQWGHPRCPLLVRNSPVLSLSLSLVSNGWVLLPPSAGFAILVHIINGEKECRGVAGDPGVGLCLVHGEVLDTEFDRTLHLCRDKFERLVRADLLECLDDRGDLPRDLCGIRCKCRDPLLLGCR